MSESPGAAAGAEDVQRARIEFHVLSSCNKVHVGKEWELGKSYT